MTPDRFPKYNPNPIREWKCVVFINTSNSKKYDEAVEIDRKYNKTHQKLCVVTRYATRIVTDLPEPHDLFAISSIVSVNGVPLPVRQVDLLHSTQHDLRPKIKT